ncbi:hypothetical protein WN51_05956 [Melipona quadrifasciata]|uniref:Uncharacterized protein n=1 Tax=Melipona quadrifasciata TaxID=166423 RepID=A0A0N0BIR6_9HYME|nr:hypothetical protein WN51_05956 [Melipona quadrifasciata]
MSRVGTVTTGSSGPTSYQDRVSSTSDSQDTPGQPNNSHLGFHAAAEVNSTPELGIKCTRGSKPADVRARDHLDLTRGPAGYDAMSWTAWECLERERLLGSEVAVNANDRRVGGSEVFRRNDRDGHQRNGKGVVEQTVYHCESDFSGGNPENRTSSGATLMQRKLAIG